MEAGDAASAPLSGSESVADPDLLAQAERTVVVDFVDGTTKAQFDSWEQAWGVDLEFNSEHGVVTGITIATGVENSEGLLRSLREHPAVESAEMLSVYSTRFEPNDPGFDRQWNLKMIDMPAAWEHNRGKGVVVAVIDTGIAYEDRGDFRRVPDLKGVRFVPGYDFVNDTPHANDDHGHGTHVAGTIAQATHNKLGVAGIAHEASLMPIKVLNHFGAGTSADIADAIRWAADHGAQVINLSLGGGMRSRVMEQAIAHARAKGVTVVAAAGNRGIGKVEFPAAYDGVIAVGAVGPDGQRAPYSSYGAALDLVAPGGNKSLGGDAGGVVQNTIDPRDPSRSIFGSYQGTSMATPHVAGVAALLYAAGANDPDEVERALIAGAKPMGGALRTDDHGHGLLNARGALEALQQTGKGKVNWSPLAWASVLLAGVLLTLRGRARPGYLNVLFGPRFLISLVLTTVGAFFLRWLGDGDTLNAASLPLPDLERIIFGRGRLANPLMYSALVPLLLSFAAIARKSLRPVVAGVSIGFAAMLAYAAWSGAPALAWLPFKALALPWLTVHAFICLFIGRAMLRREEGA
ncbi:MAG TPA: S8 family serine peptidase [Myxococcaceae bacterium]|nr:S8 family serine peptidase [Myxococcaceae bacterium]